MTATETPQPPQKHSKNRFRRGLSEYWKDTKDLWIGGASVGLLAAGTIDLWFRPIPAIGTFLNSFPQMCPFNLDMSNETAADFATSLVGVISWSAFRWGKNLGENS